MNDYYIFQFYRNILKCIYSVIRVTNREEQHHTPICDCRIYHLLPIATSEHTAEKPKQFFTFLENSLTAQINTQNFKSLTLSLPHNVLFRLMLQLNSRSTLREPSLHLFIFFLFLISKFVFLKLPISVPPPKVFSQNQNQLQQNCEAQLTDSGGEMNMQSLQKLISLLKGMVSMLKCLMTIFATHNFYVQIKISFKAQ